MNLQVSAENIGKLRACENALSHVEVELGKVVSERFPTHPRLEASELELMVWWSAKDVREKRIESLLSRRRAATGEILRLLAQP
jgi:hypothetical protein